MQDIGRSQVNGGSCIMHFDALEQPGYSETCVYMQLDLN